jgi:alpha-glucosidase
MTGWWRHAVVYQVYPRSFADSNGDGIGDLRGLTDHLDHLVWLGVDALWLNPIMPSPDADWGYDVSDYRAVHPAVGSLADFDALLAAAHRCGLRVLLDLVPNHTSVEHPWFRDPAKADWYVWADPAPDGGPPNNWLSLFGNGPAWTRDPASGRFYLHSFLPSQPDLNWWNEDVRAAFDAILRFWLDRGVDGFRIDVAAGMVKDRGLRDNPPAEASDHAVVRAHGQRPLFNQDRPEVHHVLKRWRAIADAYPHEPVLLGEAYVLDPDRLAAYYGDGDDELHLAFDFLLLHAPLRAEALRPLLQPRHFWPALTGSNHDAGRLATRWAHGDEDLVRCALMLVLLGRGTPVLYYGDELGLPAVPVPSGAQRDLVTYAHGLESRDASRTPMPWHAGPGGGFTAREAEPWLPLGDDLARRSVAVQRADPTSTLWFTRRLLALRRTHAELRTGGLELLDAPPGVLAWRRGSRFEVWLNLGDTPAPLPTHGAPVLATREDNGLDPRSGVVLDTRSRS